MLLLSSSSISKLLFGAFGKLMSGNAKSWLKTFCALVLLFLNFFSLSKSFSICKYFEDGEALSNSVSKLSIIGFCPSNLDMSLKTILSKFCHLRTFLHKRSGWLLARAFLIPFLLESFALFFYKLKDSFLGLPYIVYCLLVLFESWNCMHFLNNLFEETRQKLCGFTGNLPISKSCYHRCSS